MESQISFEDMEVRVTRVKALLEGLEAVLQSFAASRSQFQLVRTVKPPPANTRQQFVNSEAEFPSYPSTVFILDASYNPPTLAHLSLAWTAVKFTTLSAPHRLLLLFSTSNADKAPKPASFVQRLAMMLLFAEDLQERLQSGITGGPSSLSSSSSSSSPPSSSEREVAIDVGLTKSPYYTDKSKYIAGADPPVYQSNPTHVHLLGYDTVTRLLAPKYYPTFSPPLSALASYFEAGHRFLVLPRPSDGGDGADEDQQRQYIESLREGAFEGDGFQRKWADQIGLLERKTAGDISSTAIRSAVQSGDWKVVENRCSPGVTSWIKQEGLYKSSDG